MLALTRLFYLYSTHQLFVKDVAVFMCVKTFSGIVKDGTTWKTTKYTDSFQCPTGVSPDMRIWERRLLYCVPVSSQ